MTKDYDPRFEQWKAEVLVSLESFKGVIQFAVLAIKSTIVINGGAIVVLMALLGSLWNAPETDAPALAKALSSPFIYFIIGLVSGVAAAGLAYIAQASFLEQRDEKPWILKMANTARVLALISGVSSIFFFTLGAFGTLNAFSGL